MSATCEHRELVSAISLNQTHRGKNAFALSKVLAEAIGRSFIETALDSSVT